MDNLKPCPFCGLDAELISDDTTTYGYPTPNWAVRCVNEICIANDIFPNYSQHEDAVEDWNRRAQPANDHLTLDELRGMDKEPVWIDEREEPKYSGWYIAYWDRGKYLVLQSISTHGFLMDEYGKTWLAYRRPPDKEG